VSWLIDTNAWIAFFEDGPALSDLAASVMESPMEDCSVSVASIWEAAIKVGLGKLKLPYDLKSDLPRLLADNGFEVVAVTVEDATAVQDLPPIHGDTFDRIQVVQARRRGWKILSRDPIFDQYDLTRVW
jgi:PIN domain nuclease of toxin-antitoxin system